MSLLPCYEQNLTAERYQHIGASGIEKQVESLLNVSNFHVFSDCTSSCALFANWEEPYSVSHCLDGYFRYYLLGSMVLLVQIVEFHQFCRCICLLIVC